MVRYLLSESSDVRDLFESFLLEMGLTFEAVPLKTRPDATHWHIKQVGATGTLEATFLFATKELWIEQRANRSAPWQAHVIENLSHRFGSIDRDPV